MILGGYIMIKAQYIAHMRADDQARANLVAKGIQDPRLTKFENSLEQYDKIREYDSKLAGEIVKILQSGNIPLSASNDTKNRSIPKHWAENY